MMDATAGESMAISDQHQPAEPFERQVEHRLAHLLTQTSAPHVGRNRQLHYCGGAGSIGPTRLNERSKLTVAR